MDLQLLMQQMYSGASVMTISERNINGYSYGIQSGQHQLQPIYPFLPTENGDQVVGQLVDDDDEEEEDEEQRTLYCGNLDERVTEEILYEVFLQAGPIEGVRIPTDNNGRPRNFGFVTYQRLCAVPFALDLYQGLELFQKKVTIKQQGGKQLPVYNQSRLRPFMMEAPPQPSPVRHARHSLHDGKPYDRNPFGHNGDQRRRSDSSVMERNRLKPQQHHQHMQGGSRRSDQRHNNKRRLL